MAIDYDKLLNYRIPEVRQELTKRDAVLYALSVGLGRDPMDERQLDFVDFSRDLKALPTWPVVLCHPGFWLANPATGVDAVRVVHGEERLSLHEPLPSEGELLGRTRVTGIVDKGEGKGALLYSEKQVIDVRRDRLLATVLRTTFVRGDGGFGGPAGPVLEAAAIPDGEPDLMIDLTTRPEQALLYRFNGDDNPLHLDPAVATSAGFERPILQGLCTLGTVGHALLRGLCDYEPGRLKNIEARFSKPVYPGETIRTEIWKSGAFRARVLERDIVVLNNGRAVMAAG
jgi:acyl dehydratase